MQEHGGAAAEAAITSFERSFFATIAVDWNRNGAFDHPLSQLGEYVEDVTVDRSFNGSAPPEILLVEGASAAELTIRLGGEYDGMSLTTIFSPFNTQSPLYSKVRLGAEIVYKITVETASGPVTYPQFIGKIRTITPVRGENYVEITALDRSEALHKPVRLPTWAVSDEHMNYRESLSQLAYSHWVIDHCLRLCDVSTTPKRPVFREEQDVPDDGLDGVQLFVTGNGSYLPTVGYLDNPNADSFPPNSIPMYRTAGQRHPLVNVSTNPGPLGLAGLGLPINQRYSTPGDQGIIRYWSADRDNINPQSTHFLGFTLNTNGTNSTAYQSIGDFRALEVYIGMGRSLEIWIGAGKVWSRRVNYASNGSANDTAKVTIPTGQDNVDIFVEWDNTSQSGSRAYVRAGSATTGFVTVGTPVTTGSNVGADQIKGRVTIGQGLGMSDIFYSVRNYYGSIANDTDEAWRPAKYAAVLDAGKNRFTHMPNDDTREAWGLITDIASAEFGAVFWDEQGVFRFWNSDTIRSLQATTVRYLTLDDVSGLEMTDSIDSVRNIYTVKTEKKRAVIQGAVYDSQDVNEFYVPARTERKFRVFKSDILSPLTFQLPKYISKVEYNSGTNNWPVWDDKNTSHGYCIQYQNSSGLWRELHDRNGVDVSVYFTTGGLLTVKIWNGWEEPIRLATGSLTDSARPAFRFAGTLVIDDDTMSVITRDRPSIKKYDAQNLTLEGSWYQDTYEAHDMVSSLIVNTVEPQPSTDGITIAGDPRLQLGDTLGISDPGGLGEGMRVQIIGLKRTFSRDAGLSDDLTVEMLNPTPQAAVTPPTAPQNLTVRYVTEDTVVLDWDDVPNALHYRIYDEINEPTGVARDYEPTSSFSVRKDLANGTYRYKVTAVNAGGESGPSITVEAPIPFSAPANPTLTFVSSSAWANGGQNPAPTYPTGIQENDILYAVLHSREAPTVPAVTTGWTQVATMSGGGSVTPADDVGPTRVTYWKRTVPAGGLTGTVTFSNLGTTAVQTTIHAFRPSSGVTTAEASAFVSRETASANLAGTTSGTVALAPDDFVLVCVGSPSDLATSQNISGVSTSGITFGSITRTPDATGTSATGFDLSNSTHLVKVTAGTSTQAITFAGSHNATYPTTGIVAALRIRPVY